MTKPTPKSKRSRWRYILFEGRGELDEREVVYFTIRHLTSDLSANVKMIRFHDGCGIVKVERSRAIDARRALDARVATPSGELALKPLRTSGTLGALRKRSARARGLLRRD